jgi:thiol-disulfide isomerase/thioredoxin
MGLRIGARGPALWKVTIPMRNALRISILALALLFVAPAQPSVAQLADLPGLRGAGLRAADLENGNAILVVWTTWSPRCRDIVERVNALQQRWGGKARVFAVNFNEDRAEVERFLQGKAINVPVVLDADGSFSKRNAITALPGLILAQDGKITYAGKLPDSPESLLAGRLGG